MSRRKNRIGIFDRIIAISVAVLVFIAFAFFLWTNIQENNKQEEDREVVQAFDAKEIATIAASTVTEDQIKKQKDKILNKEKESIYLFDNQMIILILGTFSLMNAKLRVFRKII